MTGGVCPNTVYTSMTGRQTHGLHIDDGGCTRYIGESQEQIKIVRTQISENRLHIDDGGSPTMGC